MVICAHAPEEPSEGEDPGCVLTSLPFSSGCGDTDLLQWESSSLPDLVLWESPVSLPLQPATEVGYSLATWLESSPDPMVPQVTAFLFTVNL